MKKLKTIFLIFIFVFLTVMGMNLPAHESSAGNDKKSLSPFEADKLKNNKAPDFDIKDINGRTVSLSSFKGKIVLLNFWATWCLPCRTEMPAFNRLYNEMKSNGVEILAVSADNSVSNVKDYLSKNRFDFQIFWDEDLAVTKKFKVFSMPTTFLIDRNGIIVEKFFGEHDWASPSMKKKLEKL